MQNILMFMVDQLSAKWFEIAMKDNVCPLPNFKKLLSNGTYFSNAITSNPVCCPTRATIATGLTTRGHGVLENGYELNRDIPTFMKVLQENGYTTGVFGKLHFEPHYKSLHPDYHSYGFDVAHITEDSRGGEWLDWIMKEHPEHLDDILATIWAKNIPEFKEYGENKINLYEKICEIQKNYDWTTENQPNNSFGAYTQKFPKELCQTEWISSKALEFLYDENVSGPIFAQVSYVQPHGPFNVPEEYLKYVDESKIPKPAEAEWLTDPDTPNYFKNRKPAIPLENLFERKCYFADLVHLDEQLGKIMKCLEETNRQQNTTIIFLSDHGELLYDHSLRSKEEKHYDACIRVPMIISGENLGNGNTHSGMVQHEDICPTIMDITGLKMPPLTIKNNFHLISEEKAALTYGKSLVGICNGTDNLEREYAYSESYSHIGSIEYTNWARTVRSKEYRYTYYADFSGEQLFDLINDPNEQNNLANNDDYKEIKRNLKDVMMELIIKQDYPKTPQNLFGLGAH